LLQCSDVAAKAVANALVVCIAPSELSWVSFLGPGLIFVSAIVALVGVINARDVAKQRATLDFIEKVESTEHYRKLNSAFSALRQSKGFAHLTSPAEEDKPDRSAMMDYLNHYEMVSIGIRRNILDGKIYREWMLGPFVRDWNAASDWIQRERWKWDPEKGAWSYRSRLYANYQWAACSWSKDGRKLTKHTTPPPAAAAGPGDEALPEPIGEPPEKPDVTPPA
jgi:hypothetical protein